MKDSIQKISVDFKRFWLFTGPLSLVTVLLLITGLSIIGEEWIALTWVISSMSGYWMINRLLHGVGGTAGETERDGVIWLLPLATGWIPCIAILVLRIHIQQAGAVFIWSLIPTALIMFFRPEINHDAYEPKHL